MSSGPMRRFRIWGICFLIVFALVSIVLVIRLTSRPAEPYVSVTFGHEPPWILNIQVSNKASFSVDYWLEGQFSRSGKWTTWAAQSLAAHSQIGHGHMELTEGFRICVLYHRKLKPIEVTVLTKFPWLSQHYPFCRRRCSPIYELQATTK